MSDYKDYEVKVTYQGYINVSAINEEEAYKIAREVVEEEANYDIAKRSQYDIEQVTE